MDRLETLTLAEIVRHNYKAAAVLEKFSLDFCCNGGRQIDAACKEGNVDTALVIEELTKLEAKDPDDPNFEGWSLHKLVDYIKIRHHAYVEQNTPVLKRYLDKICQVHGVRHPELIEVRRIFWEVADGLIVHMKKEELMLFPFIKKIELAKESKATAQSPLFKTVSSPVATMKADHAEEGERLSRIAALTNHYTAPVDACNTYRVTYDLLREFEQDLHIHIHIENNILFPAAIQLESELN
jgi:regulator of cell morphogenesis and NO signaling